MKLRAVAAVVAFLVATAGSTVAATVAVPEPGLGAQVCEIPLPTGGCTNIGCVIAYVLNLAAPVTGQEWGCLA